MMEWIHFSESEPVSIWIPMKWVHRHFRRVIHHISCWNSWVQFVYPLLIVTTISVYKFYSNFDVIVPMLIHFNHSTMTILSVESTKNHCYFAWNLVPGTFRDQNMFWEWWALRHLYFVSMMEWIYFSESGAVKCVHCVISIFSTRKSWKCCKWSKSFTVCVAFWPSQMRRVRSVAAPLQHSFSPTQRLPAAVRLDGRVLAALC